MLRSRSAALGLTASICLGLLSCSSPRPSGAMKAHESAATETVLNDRSREALRVITVASSSAPLFRRFANLKAFRLTRHPAHLPTLPRENVSCEREYGCSLYRVRDGDHHDFLVAFMTGEYVMPDVALHSVENTIVAALPSKSHLVYVNNGVIVESPNGEIVEAILMPGLMATGNGMPSYVLVALSFPPGETAIRPALPCATWHVSGLPAGRRGDCAPRWELIQRGGPT